MKSFARLRLKRTIDGPSAFVAFVLTATTFAAVFAVTARTLSLRSAALKTDPSNAREVLVYLDQRSVEPRVEAPRETVSPRPSAVRARIPNRRAESAPSSEQRTPKAVSPASPPTALAGPSPIFLPPYRPQSRSTPSPFDSPRARNPFLGEEPRTRAELDSILTVMSQGIPLLAATRTPTQSERDSLAREQSRARVVPGRPPQMPGGAGMSISVPIFAAGPSPAERRRDSAANAEYVGRLRRLQARVSASRESLRVADSMSRGRAP